MGGVYWSEATSDGPLIKFYQIIVHALLLSLGGGGGGGNCYSGLCLGESINPLNLTPSPCRFLYGSDVPPVAPVEK